MNGTASASQRLANADAAATGLPANADAIVLPCQRHVIEVRVLDEDDGPLTGVPVALFDDSGRTVRSKTDGSGVARFTGLAEKTYQYSLYTLGEQSWEQVTTSTLTNGTFTAGEPPWSLGAAGGAAETHTVEQDECVAKLADRFGLTPSEIWDANGVLGAGRTSMNVLAPKDALVIPARIPKMESAAVDTRYTAKRKAAMTWLRVRFLDENGDARSEVPFLLSVERLCRRPVADVSDNTTDEGMVIWQIPADASIARVTLDDDDEPEEHVFHLSRLDPVDLPKGLQGRLSNLGYGCGDEDGTIGPLTKRAIACFQRDLLMSSTGDPDAETLMALVNMHGS